MEAADELLVRHLRRRIARRDKAIRQMTRVMSASQEAATAIGQMGKLAERMARDAKQMQELCTVLEGTTAELTVAAGSSCDTARLVLCGGADIESSAISDDRASEVPGDPIGEPEPKRIRTSE